MYAKYSIPIHGLKEGHHDFVFDIDSDFFESFEESEVKEGSIKVVAGLVKEATHLDIGIKMNGTLTVACDRCLDDMDYPITFEGRVSVRSGVERSEEDLDVIFVQDDVLELDLSQYFYDAIMLSLPIQRVHPDDEDGKSGCNPLMLKKIDELMCNEEDKEIVDPRWGQLRDIKNN